ncbi:fasciclin-like arabinogalactan family protein [Actinidia rufa]|uniref:Fasciclin-like arabinogalactan family protein n=1 Tax=Actinidia rufa TaxID=165716 RepID=A0A7J0DNM8_9ERIC|nr:fasciclin-like arabinogalactan family protein [Actinidia rufa]
MQTLLNIGTIRVKTTITAELSLFSKVRKSNHAKVWTKGNGRRRSQGMSEDISSQVPDQNGNSLNFLFYPYPIGLFTSLLFLFDPHSGHKHHQSPLSLPRPLRLLCPPHLHRRRRGSHPPLLPHPARRHQLLPPLLLRRSYRPPSPTSRTSSATTSSSSTSPGRTSAASPPPGNSSPPSFKPPVAPPVISAQSTSPATPPPAPSPSSLPAAAAAPSNATVLSLITTIPYNLTILSVNSLLVPFGFDLTASETRPPLGLNITKALIDGHNFNVAASMLAASGLADEFEQDEGGAGITMFVPTDDAFLRSSGDGQFPVVAGRREGRRLEISRSAFVLPARLARVDREPGSAHARNRGYGRRKIHSQHF